MQSSWIEIQLFQNLSFYKVELFVQKQWDTVDSEIEGVQVCGHTEVLNTGNASNRRSIERSKLTHRTSA